MGRGELCVLYVGSWWEGGVVVFFFGNVFYDLLGIDKFFSWFLDLVKVNYFEEW